MLTPEQMKKNLELNDRFKASMALFVAAVGSLFKCCPVHSAMFNQHVADLNQSVRGAAVLSAVGLLTFEEFEAQVSSVISMIDEETEEVTNGKMNKKQPDSSGLRPTQQSANA
jgi:hypothetical protein